MQTVLITGANGFVGFYLSQKLLRKGFKVVATGKGVSRLPFKHENFTYTTLDFTNKENIQKVFENVQPHFVVHAGAVSKPDECEAYKENAFLTNVTGTIYLLEEAQKWKSFFLFISTDFVFEGKSLDYKENDETKPVNYYGETKKLAEEEVKRYALDWAIVRPILVYGHPKTGRHNLLTTVAQQLRKGEELKIFIDQQRKPTYVEDLVFALVATIEKRAKGIFNICGKDVVTPYDMACAVAEYLDLDKNKIQPVTVDTFLQPAKRPPITGFDLTKAKENLGYEPTSFVVGLQKTFED